MRDNRLALLSAVAASKLPSHLRVISHPVRTLIPRLTRAPRVQLARTFWGGNMEVVIPELVSTQVWRYGYFEQAVCTFMLEVTRSGATVFDVGAHFGFFALLASHLAGTDGAVYAIEPTPSTYDILVRNVLRHGTGAPIYPINIAASDDDGVIEILDFGTKYSAFNTAAGTRMAQPPPEKCRIQARARPLDALATEIGRSVDVVKIDAESWEPNVVAGMSEIIRKDRPAVIIELGDLGKPVACSRSIVGSLCEMEYSPFEVAGNVIRPHTPRETYGHTNLLFLPR